MSQELVTDRLHTLYTPSLLYTLTLPLTHAHSHTFSHTNTHTYSRTMIVVLSPNNTNNQWLVLDQWLVFRTRTHLYAHARIHARTYAHTITHARTHARMH